MKTDEIEILGIIIMEPAVSFSDIITGVISLILAYSLWKKKSPDKSLQLFIYYFVFMGLATVIAGIIGHGLLYYLSPDWKIVGWSLSAIGLFFLEKASLEYFGIQLGPVLVKNLKIIINLQIAAFFILLLFPFTRSFTLVQFNATFCYIGIILPLYTYSIFVWKNPASWLVIAAITLASTAALVYNMEITISQWFNHHVFTHVLMALYVLLIYYAVVRLHPALKEDSIEIPS